MSNDYCTDDSASQTVYSLSNVSMPTVPQWTRDLIQNNTHKHKIAISILGTRVSADQQCLPNLQ